MKRFEDLKILASTSNFHIYASSNFQIKKSMIIKVLGTGCANCKTLEKSAQIAVSEMGIEAQVVKEEDIQKIMMYGIMRTPALVIDEKVALYGRVPSVKELKEIITKYQ